jgi:HNH endonuclease
VLRKVEVQQITTRRHWRKRVTVTYWFGRNKGFRWKKIKRVEWQQRLALQQRLPLCVLSAGERQYWLYKDKCYWEDQRLSRDQVKALLDMRLERDAARVQQAEEYAALGSQSRVRANRQQIPDDIKRYVFRRDKGRCVRCGSRNELQYDHIIPIALNGSSTAENLQILCGPCNRRKGGRI